IKSENIFWVVLAAIGAYLFINSKPKAAANPNGTASSIPFIGAIQQGSSQIAPTITAVGNAATGVGGFLSKLFGGGGSSSNVPPGSPASVQSQTDWQASEAASQAAAVYPSIDLQPDPNIG